MRAKSGEYSVGIEEEHFIVVADTGELRIEGASDEAVYALSCEWGTTKTEQFRCQIETNTRTCSSVAEAIECAHALRRLANERLGNEGLALLAAGTHPLGATTGGRAIPTRKKRYETTDWHAGPLAAAALTGSTHLHIGMPRADALRVESQSGAIIPALGAATCASDWFEGARSPYRSSRMMLRAMMPNGGATPEFENEEEREKLERWMQAMDRDAHTAWRYDARASRRHPTFEIRIADQMADIGRVAAWCTAATAIAIAINHGGIQWLPDIAAPVPRTLANAWRTACARDGLNARLVGAFGETTAREQLIAVLEACGEPLRDAGYGTLAEKGHNALETVTGSSGESDESAESARAEAKRRVHKTGEGQ